jgi:hypothetical protein
VISHATIRRILENKARNIAGARQIFHKNFFFFLQGKLPQEVKKKTLF